MTIFEPQYLLHRQLDDPQFSLHILKKLSLKSLSFTEWTKWFQILIICLKVPMDFRVLCHSNKSIGTYWDILHLKKKIIIKKIICDDSKICTQGKYGSLK